MICSLLMIRSGRGLERPFSVRYNHLCTHNMQRIFDEKTAGSASASGYAASHLDHQRWWVFPCSLAVHEVNPMKCRCHLFRVRVNHTVASHQLILPWRDRFSESCQHYHLHCTSRPSLFAFSLTYNASDRRSKPFPVSIKRSQLNSIFSLFSPVL
jgi:hypothetical protein